MQNLSLKNVLTETDTVINELHLANDMRFTHIRPYINVHDVTNVSCLIVKQMLLVCMIRLCEEVSLSTSFPVKLFVMLYEVGSKVVLTFKCLSMTI